MGFLGRIIVVVLFLKICLSPSFLVSGKTGLGLRSVSIDSENQDSQISAGEEVTLTEMQSMELELFEEGIKTDPEHYYRAPGNKCNTTEHIKAEVKRMNESGLSGDYFQLKRHKLERGNCLWYTMTECMEVPKKQNHREKEFRCICAIGRTWDRDNRACLAYDGQPCLWDADCVINANCEMSNVSESDPQFPNDERRKRRNIVSGYKSGMFKHGTCVCEPLASCQRVPSQPPYFDDGQNQGQQLGISFAPFATSVMKKWNSHCLGNSLGSDN
ncbi:unnamed protein product [Allacma fusca]|uniref:Uncharacterized protein n=1 Tax=Allacma fusca TaxID=39272 RepID=A0A8J2JNY0_9HEXA|nr:unnamed protein product [Allacma fusca]